MEALPHPPTSFFLPKKKLSLRIRAKIHKSFICRRCEDQYPNHLSEHISRRCAPLSGNPKLGALYEVEKINQRPVPTRPGQGVQSLDQRKARGNIILSRIYQGGYWEGMGRVIGKEWEELLGIERIIGKEQKELS